jgi:hypothetical protein
MDLSPLIAKLASEAGLAISILSLACGALLHMLKTLYNRLNAVLDKYIEQSNALLLAVNNLTNVVDNLRDDVKNG